MSRPGYFRTTDFYIPTSKSSMALEAILVIWNTWNGNQFIIHFTLIDSTTATLPEPEVVFNQITSVASQNSSSVMLTGLHYRYERFKSNAVSSNLVSISSNKIYDVAGRPTTPYEIKEVFAIVPHRSSLIGATHKFLFKPDLFYTNTGKTISTLSVDFNDGGGYRVVNLNVPISITYSSDGEKRLIFKINYTDGTNKESHTKIKVSGTSAAQARYVGLNIQEFQFPLTGFPAPKAYQSVAGQALVTVEYTNPERVIRRPLIIVEGFDPWRILSPDDPSQNMGFRNVLVSNVGGFNRVINLSTGQTLSDALEGNDYDLIFIDFQNGTDHIQRNAFLVENIIQWVNSVKQPYNGVPQKNVVLGFSMGGLVARYALRDMEVNNVVHDTRLNISFDSPHQGANVPVAFQAAILHLAGSGIGVGVPGLMYFPDRFTFGRMVPELGRARDLLNTPAARQMLRYQVTGGGDLLLYDNAQHTSFMNEYRQLGYPIQNGIRNLVIANGSECGTNQGFLAGASIVNVNERYNLQWWATLLGHLLSPNAVLTNYPQFAFGPTATNLRYEFKVNALPNQSAQEIYKFKLTVRKRILFVINVDVTLINKSFSSSASFLPLDNSAGGIYDISRLGTLPVSPSITTFCFVPTFSSLDIGGGTQTITSADLSNSYSPAVPPPSPKNVRAANFFTNPTEGGRSNEVHTMVTLRNGNWLLQEIQGTPAFSSCFGSCTNIISISGPSTVCPSATYFLQPQPTNLTVTWSSGNTSLLSVNSATGIATRVGTGSGSTTIRATISGTCCSQTITRSVQVGGFSQSQIIVTGTAGVCPGNQYQYTATVPGGHQAGYTYQWNKPSGWSVQTQNINTVILYVPQGNTNYGTVTASVNNGCGSSGYAGITVYPGFGCSGFSFSAFPNPATSALTVEMMAESGDSLNTESSTLMMSNGLPVTFTAELRTDHDKLIMTKESKDGRVTFDTSPLRKGLYLLKISVNGLSEVKRILLE